MRDRQSPMFLVSCLVAFFACVPFVPIAHAQWTAMNPVKHVQQQPDGALFTMGTGTLKVQVCADSVIHVLYSPTATFPKRTDFVVTKESWAGAQFTMQSTDDAVIAYYFPPENHGHAQGWGDCLRRMNGAVTAAGTVPPHDSCKGEWRRYLPRGDRSSTSMDRRKRSTGWDSTRRECGIIAASRSIFRRTTPIFPFRCWCRATATAFSGTTLRAADSTIASPTICTSALKSPT